MDFTTFKEKIIERRECLIKLEYATSQRNRVDLMDRIKRIEKEISGRGQISKQQFDTRLANFFQISKEEFIPIIKNLCTKSDQTVEFIRDKKTGEVHGLRFGDFKNYLFMLENKNFSLKCLYEKSITKTCWDELFAKYPTLESRLWNYMGMKSKLLNEQYSEILNMNIQSRSDLIQKLIAEKERLIRSEGKKVTQERVQLINLEIEKQERVCAKNKKEIDGCKNGKVSIFN